MKWPWSRKPNPENDSEWVKEILNMAEQGRAEPTGKGKKKRRKSKRKTKRKKRRKTKRKTKRRKRRRKR